MKYFFSAMVFLANISAFSNSSEAAEASNVEPWLFWSKEVAHNINTIDHGIWDTLLKEYVVSNHPSGINRFRYGDVGKTDRNALKRYLKGLGKIVPREYRRAEQKAYWINLHNALVVQQVLNKYPIKSITDISRKGRKSPWDEKIVKIEGKKLSLNDIKNRILRPIWSDHKVHFALANGTLGGPSLQPRAYTARNVRNMLKSATRQYINHPRGLRLEKGEMYASQVFSDYQLDFAKSKAKLLKLFAYYVDDTKALYILGFQGDIKYHSDFRLNSI